MADRHARQRGLVAQEILADARITIRGSGVALPYLVQCLTLMGVARRFGHIRLVDVDRPVREEDVSNQFLLDQQDIGRPLGEALVSRIHDIDPDVVIAPSTAPGAGRDLVLAVPRASEVDAIRASGQVDIWGGVTATAVRVGPEPPTSVSDRTSVLTAPLGGVCGGLLAQAVLIELGAVVDGPAVVSSWLEERVRIVSPGIGSAAREVVNAGVPEPDLLGVLERVVPPDQLGRFTVHLDDEPARARVTLVVDDDEIVASAALGGTGPMQTRLTVRPALRPARRAASIHWSPLTEPTGDDVLARLPEARVVMCGAGALGSWAAAVLAASGAVTQLCVVDMDDAVEAHNLNRQILFGTNDIGAPKSVRTTARLARINPSMKLSALTTSVTRQLLREPAKIRLPAIFGRNEKARQEAEAARARQARLVEELASATAILSCPDNQQTRWILNVLAERADVPMVNGAADGFTGRVHVCDPASASMCLVCWLGESIADDPRRRSCTDVIGALPIQSIVTTAAIVGSAQAAALLATLGGAGDRVARFHTWDGLNQQLSGHRAGDREHGECPGHLLNAGAASEKGRSDGHPAA